LKIATATPTVGILGLILAITVICANGLVKPDLTVIVIVVAVSASKFAAQHPIPLGARPRLRLAAVVAVLHSTMASLQDVLWRRVYGELLEAPVPLSGGSSKTALIAKFVLRGGMQLATGAQSPSIEVPELV